MKVLFLKIGDAAQRGPLSPSEHVRSHNMHDTVPGVCFCTYGWRAAPAPAVCALELGSLLEKDRGGSAHRVSTEMDRRCHGLHHWAEKVRCRAPFHGAPPAKHNSLQPAGSHCHWRTKEVPPTFSSSWSSIKKWGIIVPNVQYQVLAPSMGKVNDHFFQKKMYSLRAYYYNWILSGLDCYRNEFMWYRDSKVASVAHS